MIFTLQILQDDDLPKFICHECKIRLHNAYDFVSLCKRSNDKLHEHYEKNKRCQVSYKSFIFIEKYES